MLETDLNEQVHILVKCLENATMPKYMTEEAAGADVSANLSSSITISPGCAALIPTGLFFDIPKGYEIQVRPRSGLAFKHQITVLNTPGTIDSDYRGELKVLLINHGKEDFVIEHGMRIAQIIIAPVFQAKFSTSESLSRTGRGAGGFGHSGH